MLQRAAVGLTRWTIRWIPDAWIIAVILTIITYILGLLFSKHNAYELIQDWGNGFWVLLSFAMQMSLIIITGYVLAVSRPLYRFFNWLAGLPKNPVQVVGLMALVSMALGWINWGLSIVGSAVFARYIIRKQKGVDYPLLITCAYLGLGGIWHAGLSGSAPLLVATPGHFMEKDMGIVTVASTIFLPFNMLLVLIIAVVWTLLAMRMHPSRAQTTEADPSLVKTDVFTPPAVPRGSLTPSERMAHSPVINVLVGLAGVIWLWWYFGAKRGALTLDVVNFSFLILGILFHWTPTSFLEACKQAAGYVWGVIIQFPFYAGIFGMVRFSGLAETIAGWFTAISSPQTWPLIFYWYGGLLNYIVPSGGGQWTIQAPFMVLSAKSMNVSMPATVLIYSWSDMMTDVIQPFWAIPLLGVAKLEFKQIMGYGIVFFVVYAVITSVAFYLLPGLL